MISHDDTPVLCDTLPWRRAVLRRAGFGPRLAAKVAADHRYEIDPILDLTDRGCPPHLAVRILAPLEPAPR